MAGGMAAKAGPRDAFLQRTTEALRRMSHEMSEDMLLSALSAPSDLGALARAIGDTRLTDPAIRLDPLTPAVARSLEHRTILADRAGPMMSSTQVAHLLGLSRPGVDKRRAASRLLALRIGSDWLYPAFQFSGDGILPGLDLVLAAQDGADPWVVLDLLLSPDDVLGGRSLLDLLKEGDMRTVARALDQIGGDGFA